MIISNVVISRQKPRSSLIVVCINGTNVPWLPSSSMHVHMICLKARPERISIWYRQATSLYYSPHDQSLQILHAIMLHLHSFRIRNDSRFLLHQLSLKTQHMGMTHHSQRNLDRRH